MRTTLFRWVLRTLPMPRWAQGLCHLASPTKLVVPREHSRYQCSIRYSKHSGKRSSIKRRRSASVSVDRSRTRRPEERSRSTKARSSITIPTFGNRCHQRSGTHPHSSDPQLDMSRMLMGPKTPCLSSKLRSSATKISRLLRFCKHRPKRRSQVSKSTVSMATTSSTLWVTSPRRSQNMQKKMRRRAIHCGRPRKAASSGTFCARLRTQTRSEVS